MQRALYPVLGGLAFFAVLGLLLWGVAALIADNPGEVNERLAETTFEVGRVDTLSEIIAEEGPLIFPDLVRAGGTRTVVLDHTGDDPRVGWRVFFGYPADRDLECKVTQVRGTRDFTDCDGRTLAVEALAPAAGVTPLISDVVVIDLRVATTGTEPPPSTSED
jgi:hypothetical protein